MQYKFIKFGPEGYPLFYYCEVTYPPVVNEQGEAIAANPEIPADAKSVTEQQWVDAQAIRLWLATDGSITIPPTREPTIIPERVTVLHAITLWERMTEAEAVAVSEAMKTQSVRTVQIFNNATTFRSDHELWPLLEQVAVGLFGEERASEILSAE